MQPVHQSLDGMLADVIATGATWDPAAVFVGILTAIVDNGVDTVASDLTAPPTADYPRQPITAWGTPYRLSDGSAAAEGPLLTFAPPDNTHPATVVGYAYYDALTAGNLLGFTALTDPVPLTVTTDHFNVVPRLVMPASAQYEDSHFWDG